MFTHHGTYIIGLSAAKHMAMVPSAPPRSALSQSCVSEARTSARCSPASPGTSPSTTNLDASSNINSKRRMSPRSDVHSRRFNHRANTQAANNFAPISYVNHYAVRVSPEPGPTTSPPPVGTRRASFPRADPCGLGLPVYEAMEALEEPRPPNNEMNWTDGCK